MHSRTASGENLKPNQLTPDEIQRRIAEILSKDGREATLADGDVVYRDLLEEESIALLAFRNNPDRTEIAGQLLHSIHAREGYEQFYRVGPHFNP